MAPSVPTAGKSPFAHLARNAALSESDEDKKKREEEEAKKAEEDEEKRKEQEAKKKAEEEKKKKEEEEARRKAEEDGEDDEEAEEDGDDDSDREDDDEPEARAARARERGRIRAIVTSSAGKLNPVGAMELACGTSMSRRQAIGVLHAMGVPAASEPRKTDGLRNRMAGVDAPDVGSDPAPGAHGGNPVQATAAAIIAAGKKRRGEKV